MAMKADDNRSPIQVVGPRGRTIRQRVDGSSNFVNLQQNRIYRVIAEFDFHFHLGAAADGCTNQDELQPGLWPMFILVKPNFTVLSFTRRNVNGWIYITEWDA